MNLLGRRCQARHSVRNRENNCATEVGTVGIAQSQNLVDVATRVR